ncbi:MAG: hypothetical protein JXB38_06500 [Anaerolineales bacterium]|nr:hypothetical protein [Anaerolineales bacterium]
MSEALRFFKQYEFVVYTILGFGGAVYFFKFVRAWQEVRDARFGLERESGQRRLNQAAIALFLLILLGVMVFSLVTFVEPLLPVADIMSTPTIDLLATPGEEGTPDPDAEAELSVGGAATATPLPTVEVLEDGCVPGVLEITSPEPGETISGEIDVLGTVNIPDFGFYKFEIARAQESLWLTIRAQRSIVEDDVLVDNWDTSRWTPGEYVLQLVVTDNSGESLPACRIPVLIGTP